MAGRTLRHHARLLHHRGRRLGRAAYRCELPRLRRWTGADTATSDFFILLNDQPSLDFGGKRFDDEQGAAAFGHVVSGMDIVRKIQQQPTKGQNLDPPITIVTARRVSR
ncbi:MAG TPA: peptidylprolyl isomerase [Vicinamibacterales bacterium]|nr:peptidylprolyl isomerase [Vicinamibacterales bacterium]